MKYIILCGSNHALINGTPRQLVKIGGERILDRTIRLLRRNGVKDISITATDPAFDLCNAEVIHYDSSGPWVNCFYLTDEPTTYIFGDVYFSEAAIEKIVETQTDDIEFFASAPPFAVEYPRGWAEPFAFKVVNTQHFREAIETVKQFTDLKMWRRDPIAWETWQVIKGTPINMIDYSNYTVINDYTCDIDYEGDIQILEEVLGYAKT